MSQVKERVMLYRICTAAPQYNSFELRKQNGKKNEKQVKRREAINQNSFSHMLNDFKSKGKKYEAQLEYRSIENELTGKGNFINNRV